MLTRKEKEEIQRMRQDMENMKREVDMLVMRTDRMDMIDKKFEGMDLETLDAMILSEEIENLKRKIADQHIEQLGDHIQMLNFCMNVEDVIRKLLSVEFIGTGENKNTLSIIELADHMEDIFMVFGEIIRYLDYVQRTPVKERKSISTYQHGMEKEKPCF